jgi:hypothetical protein
MRHRIAALLGVVTCLAMTVVGPIAAPASADSTGSAVTVTKTITDGKGIKHTVAVSVSQTQNLLARQNVLVGWTGAVPTHNYAVITDPALNNNSEYPMVLMECWGTDHPSDPNDPFSDGAMDPTHCATSMGLNAFNPTVVKDTNVPGKPQNSTHVFNFGLSHQLQFQAVDGTWYNMYYGGTASTNDSIPPELRSGSSLPLSARGEWTGADGSRSGVPFEMRSAGEYPFLGCSDTQACTLVAVPITDPTCNTTAAANCAAGAKGPVGPGSLPQSSVNPYLRANAWWLAGNWANRISIGLSFAPQHACDVVDQRQPVTISGSEPAGTAMFYYWAPRFCLDSKSFRLKYVQQSEPLARTALTTNGPSGYGANAILSSLPVTGSPRPVVQAPVLDTGFAVSFLADNATNTQITQLKLTPLLLAKLITQSYEAGSGEPALKGNPYSMFRDPEFLAVNPGVTLNTQSPTIDYNLIMPQPTQTDVIWAMTSYINADPEARAWLDGAPDNYSGMVVNPVFRGYALPQLFTELRDGSPDPAVRVGNVDAECVKKISGPPPYFTLIKQSVNTLQDAVTALLNRQSPATPICDSNPASATFGTYIRQDRQVIGTRNLLAITSVAQANTFVMPMAQLQVHQLGNGQRLFASPTSDSMAAALGYTVQDKDSGVLSLDYAHLSANSYPGTVPIYAAIPTAGLDKASAQAYAAFLRFAVTDGQTLGTGVGNLPPGYAPLPDVLRQYTLTAADAVAAQNGQIPTPPADIAGQIRNQDGQSATVGNGPGGGVPNTVPGGGSTPSTSAAPSSAAAPTSTPTTLATTRGVDSWLAAWGLPMLLGFGLLAGIGVPLVRLAAQPGHPVRVALATAFDRTLGKALPRRSK